LAVPSQLGRQISAYRRRAGLTQQELADLAGMSAAGVRDLEQGRVARPRAGTMRRLVDVLRLTRLEAGELVRVGDQGRAPDAGVRVDVLGPLRITVDGAPVDLGSDTQRILLGLLALSPNAPVGRDALVEAGWGQRPPSTVVELLQSRMSRLRRRLLPTGTTAESAQLVVAARGGYQLTVSDDQLDLLVFRGHVRRARQSRAVGELVEACESFGEAVALWRGAPLAGIGVLETHPVVVALVREWQAVVVEYATAMADLGRHEEVLPLLRQITSADPMHELAHARLMIALAGSGQQAAALAIFEDVRRRLADELGADPGPELAEAFQRVLRQKVSRSEAPPVSAHRQLPPDVADFSGRDRELAELHGSLPAMDDPGTAVTILSIEGMGGVGKTRLAVRFAHQLQAGERYQEVQLYVDLYGHADQPPADPADVLASFLRLLGVPGEQIPQDLEDRATLYRDRLHGRRALVLLDNAAGDEQVAPLLPAGRTNLVLITSRRTLALDGVRALPLDVFSHEEAETLLSKVVGGNRVAAEPAAAHEVITLCGRLPLAVALAARRLQARPAWRIADLVTRLAGSGDRLGELAAGSRQLRAVFELSYQALAAEEQWLFRLLGLHPGTDFTAGSVAALADLAPHETRAILDRLVDQRLVFMATGDRYRLHDLLAEYARHVVEVDEPEPARHAALERLFDYYLHVTAHAAEVVRPPRWSVDPVGEPPRYGKDFATREDAEQWLEVERATIVAVVTFGAARGWSGHAWRLAHALHEYLFLNVHVKDWIHTHEVALRAAVRAGDRFGEEVMLTYLGAAYMYSARYEMSKIHFDRAALLHRTSGNRELEMRTQNGLGFLCCRSGRFAEALRHAERELELSEDSPFREAIVRNNIGSVLGLLGRYDDAITQLGLARRITSQLGDHAGECIVLSNLCDIHRKLGRYEESIESGDLGITIATVHTARHAAAYGQYRLATTYRVLGRCEEALDLLAQAHVVVKAMGGGPVTESEVLTQIAAVHRDAGRHDEAMAVLEESLELAVTRQEPYQRAEALDGIAQVHEREGRYAAARAAAESAYELFADMGVAAAEEVRNRMIALENRENGVRA
jgi:DNA-binding SARP family transcriptional activator/DNA-binding XRE family transcriptional regulator